MMMVKKYTKIRSETDLLNLVEKPKEPIYIEVQYINYRRKLAKPVGSQEPRTIEEYLRELLNFR